MKGGTSRSGSSGLGIIALIKEAHHSSDDLTEPDQLYRVQLTLFFGCAAFSARLAAFLYAFMTSSFPCLALSRTSAMLSQQSHSCKKIWVGEKEGAWKEFMKSMQHRLNIWQDRVKPKIWPWVRVDAEKTSIYALRKVPRHRFTVHCNRPQYPTTHLLDALSKIANFTQNIIIIADTLIFLLVLISTCA